MDSLLRILIFSSTWIFSSSSPNLLNTYAYSLRFLYTGTFCRTDKNGASEGAFFYHTGSRPPVRVVRQGETRTFCGAKTWPSTSWVFRAQAILLLSIPPKNASCRASSRPRQRTSSVLHLKSTALQSAIGVVLSSILALVSQASLRPVFQFVHLLGCTNNELKNR